MFEMMSNHPVFSSYLIERLTHHTLSNFLRY